MGDDWMREQSLLQPLSLPAACYINHLPFLSGNSQLLRVCFCTKKEPNHGSFFDPAHPAKLEKKWKKSPSRPEIMRHHGARQK